jgi:hypothetical protein
MFSLGRSSGGVGGEQGAGGLTVQQRQVRLRAQLVEVPAQARSLKPLGPGGQVRVGGQHPRGRQVPSGQGGGAGILGPALDPRLSLRLLLTPLCGGGVSGDHLAADRLSQFSGSPSRRPADHRRFHP